MTSTCCWVTKALGMNEGWVQLHILVHMPPKDTIFRKLLPSVFAPGLLVRWVKLGLGRTWENGFFA